MLIKGESEEGGFLVYQGSSNKFIKDESEEGCFIVYQGYRDMLKMGSRKRRFLCLPRLQYHAYKGGVGRRGFPCPPRF